MHELDNEQSERTFYYHERNNNKANNIQNDDSLLLNTYVRYFVSMVITGKYQTSVFCVRTQPTGLVCIFKICFKTQPGPVAKNVYLWVLMHIFGYHIFGYMICISLGMHIFGSYNLYLSNTRIYFNLKKSIF